MLRFNLGSVTFILLRTQAGLQPQSCSPLSGDACHLDSFLKGLSFKIEILGHFLFIIKRVSLFVSVYFKGFPLLRGVNY